MARIGFEIELELEGDFHPSYGLDDVTIVGLGMVQMDRVAGKPSRPFSWTTTSFLDGVDLKCPAIQRLFANILKAKACEAADAIREENREVGVQARYGRHA